ncbi:MAG: EamA family transporter [Clostridia bacterium]|nr:EamA family transporter [Clostridia bacterium]
MKYLVIVVLCMMSTGKMCLQSGFGKERVNNTADTLVFNGLLCFFSALFVSNRLIGCSSMVWVYATFGAISTVLFQMFYMKALTCGNVSLTVLITNFSMVINVLFSYLCYKEPLSWIRLMGIVLTLIAFVLCTEFKSGKTAEKGWLFFAVASMFMTSCITISQKIFAESVYQAESSSFVACMYAIATVLTFFLYQGFKFRSMGKTFPIDKRTLLTTFWAGAILSIFQVLYTKAVTLIDGTFFYPATTGGIVIFSTLAGVLLFRDKLNRKQVASIILGIIAIVLMNF